MIRHLWILCLLLAASAWAAVPQDLNHQGRLAVNGANFERTGSFKFAFVSGGTSTAGSQPTGAVSLTVTKACTPCCSAMP